MKTYRQKCLLLGLSIITIGFNSFCLAAAQSATGAIGIGAMVNAYCSVGTSDNVVFTNYDPTTDMSRDATGIVKVTCTNDTTYEILLNEGAHGSSGDPDSRKMEKGMSSIYLAYQLHSDSSRNTVWGTISGAGVNAIGIGTEQSHTVYAQIRANQPDTSPGNYTDTVTITVNY